MAGIPICREMTGIGQVRTILPVPFPCSERLNHKGPGREMTAANLAFPRVGMEGCDKAPDTKARLSLLRLCQVPFKAES